MLTLHTTVTPQPNVLSTDLGNGETVLLNLESGGLLYVKRNRPSHLARHQPSTTIKRHQPICGGAL